MSISLLITGTITRTGADAAAQRVDKRNKQRVFKICSPFADCMIKANNTRTDNAKDIDLVMLMLIADVMLIAYTKNYAKTPGNL